MTRLDLSPYRRSFVGFDRLFDALERTGAHAVDNYPPFNIERFDADRYRITIAVAGFRIDEIEVVAQHNALLVKGRKNDAEVDRARFVHLGIATRSFERRFDLADYVRVSGANIADGLLTIDLVREIPEAMKPQTVAIQAGAAPAIEATPATEGDNGKGETKNAA